MPLKNLAGPFYTQRNFDPKLHLNFPVLQNGTDGDPTEGNIEIMEPNVYDHLNCMLLIHSVAVS